MCIAKMFRQGGQTVQEVVTGFGDLRTLDPGPHDDDPEPEDDDDDKESSQNQRWKILSKSMV
jgi:hypothetical protein